MGMNTEEWFKWLLETHKMDKQFNLETVAFLLGEIETLSPITIDKLPYYDYFKVKKLAEEARKITVEIMKG